MGKMTFGTEEIAQVAQQVKTVETIVEKIVERIVEIEVPGPVQYVPSDLVSYELPELRTLESIVASLSISVNKELDNLCEIAEETRTGIIDLEKDVMELVTLKSQEINDKVDDIVLLTNLELTVLKDKIKKAELDTKGLIDTKVNQLKQLQAELNAKSDKAVANLRLQLIFTCITVAVVAATFLLI